MEWISGFPELHELPAEDRDWLTAHSQLLSVPAGATVFAPGVKPENFLLLLEGVLRVTQVAENGREIVLYRARGGEICIMTSACLLAEESYLAEGVTETPAKAVSISKKAFDELLARSPAFRRVVFSKYAARMTDLQRLMENMAFERMEKRLAHKLLELGGENGATLAVTHQELAGELATAREVISRLMKRFAERGWIEGGRGVSKIRNADALRALAQKQQQ